jgi:hypothetical protein
MMDWYKGQKYELLAPGGRIGRWTWLAQLSTGHTLTGKAFRKTTAIKNAKQAIKLALRDGRGLKLNANGAQDS